MSAFTVLKGLAVLMGRGVSRDGRSEVSARWTRWLARAALGLPSAEGEVPSVLPWQPTVSVAERLRKGG